jgi:hypothetical protein
MSDKILYILEKPRAKQFIRVIVDPEDEDEWFILFQWIEKKTNVIKHQSMIIRKDIPQWIEYQKSLGWEIKTKNLT